MDILLETERLVIRPLREEDAPALYGNHRDDQVRRWFPNESYADEAEALDAIRFFAGCVESGRMPFVLGVALKTTGALIGDTGISEVEGRPGEAEIGYCIGEEYRGQGYAAEVVPAVTGFMAARFGLRVIWGRVVHGNAASARVLEKCGYVFVREEAGAEDDPYGDGMLVYRKDC